MSSHHPGPSSELPIERSRARLSAFVYGNILVLAALVQSQPDSVGDGRAIVLVAATTLTTYVAHVVADLVGHGLGHHADDHATLTLVELRDAAPIISSGGPPVLVLLAGALGWLDWLGASAVLLLAVGFVVVRLAATGAVASRYSRSSPRRIVWTGLWLAVVGLVVAVLKVVLTH